VTVFSHNDISVMRRPKNIKFDTKVGSSTRMIRTLRFLESFLVVAEFAKNAENRPKMPILQKHSYDGTMYMQKQRICGATVR